MKLCQSLAVLALLASRGASSAAAPESDFETPQDHHCCCSALAEDASLRGKVLAKHSDAYDARLETSYSANSALPAWCMVMPECTHDVSRIASILSDKQCPFGIRSGSHSAFELSNAVEHGITIDFSYMNSTTYDADKKVAAIQPGSKWGAVYQALEPHGVAASGARASVVGVGGFTSGGGYSFHSNSHGFSCDTVANWEMVLANGTVVNANENENADLWKAQKGGSGNLGFITRIDQYVIESTRIWGGFVGYDLSQRDTVFDAYINFAEKMDKDPASQEILCLYYYPTGFSMKSILTNADAIAAAPAFDEFRAIPNISTTANTTSIAEMVVQFAGPTPPGQYANWFTGSTTNDVRVMKLFDDKLHEYVDKMKAAAPESEFNILIQFQPVPPSIVEQSKARGGNMLGLEPHVADGPLLMWLIVLTVDSPENQEKILPLGVEFRDTINKETAKMGVFKDSIYVNYAWMDQDPVSTFGAENIAFLQSTSAKFDPTGAFQNLRRSGFKIP